MALDSIDVVTTATLRPELLDLTYRSFHNRLFSKFGRCRLIVNIDPLPTRDEAKLAETIAVCRRWFPEVIYRTPEVPSFPSAVRWAWSQLESDFCFHLEDDWLLLKHVDPERVAGYFSSAPSLAEVTLNPSRNKAVVPKLALRPSFFRREFIESALRLFDDALDPEKQWRRHLADGGELAGWQFRYYGEIGEGRHVRDMGAVWRKAHALGKWGSGETAWVKAQFSFPVRQWMRFKLAAYIGYWSILAGKVAHKRTSA